MFNNVNIPEVRQSQIRDEVPGERGAPARMSGSLNNQGRDIRDRRTRLEWQEADGSHLLITNLGRLALISRFRIAGVV